MFGVTIYSFITIIACIILTCVGTFIFVKSVLEKNDTAMIRGTIAVLAAVVAVLTATIGVAEKEIYFSLCGITMSISAVVITVSNR